MRRVVTISLAWLFLLAGHALAAESTPAASQADELVRRALDLRRQGDNAGAVDLLRRAEELAPSGRILAQLGFAEFALQHWVEAEASLDRALAGADSPWLTNLKNREMLEKTLSETRRHVGRLAVSGTAGVEISVNGKPVGALPLTGPIHVLPGTIRLTASAPNRKAFDKTLVVAGGEEVAVAISLDPVAPSTPAVAPISAAPHIDGTAVPAWRRWTGAGLFIAGVAAMGAGITWVVLDGRTNCTAPPGGVCQQVYDTKTQGWAAIAAGAVAAGTGATLFLWKRNEVSGVAIGPGILSMHGRF